jgi:hypothetical protein
MLLLIVLLAQAVVPLPSYPNDKTNVPPANVWCVPDSFGNVIVIPGCSDLVK